MWTPDPGTLLLVDGNNLAHRAFHATPDLQDRKGRPTGAVHGLASMLLRITSDLRHRKTVVAWDAGSSGRKDLFPDYKGTRKAPDTNLTSQWDALQELPTRLGLRSVKVDGFEADDVLGTLASQARDRGLTSAIITSDRDVMQLVSDDGLIGVLAVRQSLRDAVLYDRQAVIDRFGVAPDMITDLYGLKGDTSDNIPGITGVGDKTALRLINEFGTIEQIIAAAEKIPQKKLRANVIEQADNARLSKKLATINREVPGAWEQIAGSVGPVDESALIDFCDDYNLYAALRRIMPEVAAKKEREHSQQIALDLEIDTPPVFQEEDIPTWFD